MSGPSQQQRTPEGWERVHARHVAEGDVVRMHPRAPSWTVLRITRGVHRPTRQRRKRPGLRIEGVELGGQPWSILVDPSQWLDVEHGSPSLALDAMAAESLRVAQEAAK